MGILHRLFRGKAGAKSPWVVFRSPAGFYTLEHPVEWRISTEGNVVNIFPPDESGSVTVSAFYGTLPVPDLETLLADTFKQEEAFTERESVSRNGWTGLRQGFAAPPPSARTWVAVVAGLPPVFALATANDTPEHFRERSATYNQILDSLCLHAPEVRGGGA